jgi:hypothetical protein
MSSKISYAEWLNIIDQEEGEYTVATIVEEIVKNADEIIHKEKIQALLVPFTASTCLEESLKYVKWAFFCQDSDNMNAAAWNQDQELESLEFDSWIRGKLVVRKPTVAVKIVQEKQPRSVHLKGIISRAGSTNFSTKISKEPSMIIDDCDDILPEMENSIRAVKVDPQFLQSNFRRNSLLSKIKPSTLKYGFQSDNGIESQIYEDNQKLSVKLLAPEKIKTNPKLSPIVTLSI